MTWRRSGVTTAYGGRRRKSGVGAQTAPTGVLVASAALSGSSTVSQSGTGTLAADAELVGLGGFGGSGSLAASAALSGSSTVSQAGTGSLAASAALSGTGTLPGGLSISSLAVHEAGSTLVMTSGSVTPTAGALLVLGAACQFGSTAATSLTVTDNFGDSGGGSWTAFTGTPTNLSSNFSMSTGGWYRVIGTGPSTGSVSVTLNGSGGVDALGYVLFLDQVKGQGATPVPSGQSATTQRSFATTGNVSLPSSPASTSMVWTCSFSNMGNMSPTPNPSTSGFTNLDTYVSSGVANGADYYIIGSGPQTVAWQDLAGGQLNCLLIVEITS